MHKVILIGRPNVGKSSLFNALTGGQAALVAPEPGVTRDWRAGRWHLTEDTQVDLLDTAGMDDEHLAGRLSALTRQQAAQADILVLVLDGKAGILPADADLIQEIRRLNKPVVVVVNKADVKAATTTQLEAAGLGWGAPVAVSAAHQWGLGDLADKIMQLLPTTAEAQQAASAENMPTAQPLTLAILGRPNAGKSTLVNRVFGSERVLTGPEAGITRERVMLETEVNGRQIRLLDTPGQRRKANITDALEQAMVQEAQAAIPEADVVILLADAAVFEAQTGLDNVFHQQDMAIARHVIAAGKPLVVGLNKWDAIVDKKAANKVAVQYVADALHTLPGVLVVPFSAQTGQGVPRLLNAAFTLVERAQQQFSTARLNKLLEDIVAYQAPPLVEGKQVKLKYMTQIAGVPPTFLIFGNRVKHLPDSYKKYMQKQLMAACGLEGLTVRLIFKAGKNPYAA